MLEGLAPNLNPSLQIQGNMQQRRGRTLHVHKLATTPSHLQQIKPMSIRCYGVKLFNSLPKTVRNITNTSTEKFKHALDKFLQCVADIPYLRSGVNNSSVNSNHIYDSPTTNQSYNPISTTVEQNTTSQHLPPPPGDTKCITAAEEAVDRESDNLVLIWPKDYNRWGEIIFYYTWTVINNLNWYNFWNFTNF